MRVPTVEEIDRIMPVLFAILDQPGSADLSDAEVWAQVQDQLPDIVLADIDMLTLLGTDEPSAPDTTEA
jgi:DNA-binding LytR/AlgR family response regulator